MGARRRPQGEENELQEAAYGGDDKGGQGVCRDMVQDSTGTGRSAVSFKLLCRDAGETRCGESAVCMPVVHGQQYEGDYGCTTGINQQSCE